MPVIGSKAEVNELIEKALKSYDKGVTPFIDALHKLILKKKIRFPLLEHAAKKIIDTVKAKEQLIVADAIIDLHETGGNVLAGIILQKRLEKHFKESLAKSVGYIILGDQWFVCDIIGERVMGYALLTYPEKTIPVLKKYTAHPDK